MTESCIESLATGVFAEIPLRVRLLHCVSVASVNSAVAVAGVAAAAGGGAGAGAAGVCYLLIAFPSFKPATPRRVSLQTFLVPQSLGLTMAWDCFYTQIAVVVE